MQISAANMHVCLCDFGLALSSHQLSTHTQQQGTPGYQAPEQLRGGIPNPSWDVYSTGCVLIELFGHRPLWDNDTPYQICYKVSCGQKPAINHLAPRHQDVCNECIEEDTRRCTTAELLQKLLCFRHAHYFIRW